MPSLVMSEISTSPRLARWMAPLLALAALLPGMASAQEEACSEEITEQDFRASIARIDELIAAFELEQADSAVTQVKKAVRCIPTVVNRTDLAQFSRQRALLAFFSQDEEQGIRWGTLARIASPDLPWSESFAPAFREKILGEDLPDSAGPENQSLLIPKNGAIFLDGSLLLEPTAAIEVPHLVQVFDKKGVWVAGYWQDGAAFREEQLGPFVGPLTPSKWVIKQGLDGSGASEQTGGTGDEVVDGNPVDPVNPPDPNAADPTPIGRNKAQLRIGVGLGAAAVAMYGAAYLNKQLPPSDPSRLTGWRSRSNLLVWGAVGAGVGGAALGGLALTDSRSGFIDVQVRF